MHDSWEKLLTDPLPVKLNSGPGWGVPANPLLRGDQALALCRAGDSRPLSECLRSVDSTQGRRRVAEHLKTQPYPHYEPADSPGLLIKIDSDGKRTLGRFVNRRFQAVKKAKR